LSPTFKPDAVIDERYFLSLYSQGARAVLRYLQQIEGRIADAEARVTRSQQSLVTRLSEELARAKASLAKKTAQFVERLPAPLRPPGQAGRQAQPAPGRRRRWPR
jgi:uncharacterized coiled-coil protein SlyX